MAIASSRDAAPRQPPESRQAQRQVATGEVPRARLMPALRYSALVALLLAVAAGAGLFAPGIYRGNTAFAASAFRGTDLVSLALVLPALAVSALLAWRDSCRALLVWLGVITYVGCTYLYTFAIAGNRLLRRLVPRTGRRRPARVVLVALTLLAAGCGSVAAPSPAARPPGVMPSAQAVTPSAPSVPSSAATRAPSGPAATPSPPAASAPATIVAPPTTRQLITVKAVYGSSYATLRAYALAGSDWVEEFGPWTARVGYNGVAAPGTKCEGDGKTPSGTYAFDFFFGVLPDPGVSFAYRRAYSYDYWDDDPQSPLYNEWVDARTQNPGRNPEPMDNVPAYNYGAVIAYNAARSPGLGSAIFFHVGTGGATAGCVSLPQAELVAILCWLRPAGRPLIRITGMA